MHQTMLRLLHRQFFKQFRSHSIFNFLKNSAIRYFEQFPAKQNKIKRETSLKPEKLSDRYFKKISVTQNKIKSKEKQA
jgi:hypothetical protein